MKTSRAGQLALFFCPFLTYLLLNLRILGAEISLMLVDSSVRRALGITLLKGLEHTFQLQKYKNSVRPLLGRLIILILAFGLWVLWIIWALWVL